MPPHVSFSLKSGLLKVKLLSVMAAVPVLMRVTVLVVGVVA